MCIYRRAVVILLACVFAVLVYATIVNPNWIDPIDLDIPKYMTEAESFAFTPQGDIALLVKSDLIQHICVYDKETGELLRWYRLKKEY